MLYLALNNVLLYPLFNSHLYLEIRIGQFVGEASTTNSDSSKHTVALVLVHDKAGLHTSRLLVGVRHHTTDEVRLSLVVAISYFWQLGDFRFTFHMTI